MKVKTAVILAGGRGTRLPVSARDIPKPLVAVRGGATILDLQIERLLQHGIRDIRISLGHMAEKIIDWREGYRGPATIRFMIEKEPLGTGGGIKRAATGINEPFIAFNADNLADFDFHGLAAHAGKKDGNVLVSKKVADAKDYGVLQIERDGRIQSFLEKPHGVQTGFVNAGCYVLRPEIFAHTGESFSIEKDLFPKLAVAGALYSFPHSGEYWFDCGTEERLLEVRTFFAKKK